MQTPESVKKDRYSPPLRVPVIENRCTSVTARHPEIEWRKIAGLRDISVHSYYSVKPTILWNIIQTKLGPLEDAICAMIREEEE